MNKYRVTASSLNIRKDPTTSSTKIGSVLKGEIVEPIAREEKWSKIKKDGIEGWVSNSYLELLTTENTTNEEFPWMPIAISEIGVKEVAGDGDNPRIIEYLATVPLDTTASERRNDETAWCSAFVNWCIEKSGKSGTRKSAASSWLTWGQSVATPRRGCIAVFKRNGGNHVGFYISETANEIVLLGGNQSDAVNISKRSKAGFLGYRIPNN